MYQVDRGPKGLWSVGLAMNHPTWLGGGTFCAFIWQPRGNSQSFGQHLFLTSWSYLGQKNICGYQETEDCSHPRQAPPGSEFLCSAHHQYLHGAVHSFGKHRNFGSLWLFNILPSLAYIEIWIWIKVVGNYWILLIFWLKLNRSYNHFPLSKGNCIKGYWCEEGFCIIGMFFSDSLTSLAHLLSSYSD